MSIQTQNKLTISEQVKQIGPDGNIMDIVNTLVETNDILLDAPVKQANERFSNLSVKVLALPTIGTRRINAGGSTGIGRTKQIRDVLQIFEHTVTIDEMLLMTEVNPERARLNQIKMTAESFGQSQADALIYGNGAEDPDEIDGFVTRYNDKTLPNVYDISGTGSDTASLFVIEWTEDRCEMIYPRGFANCGIYEKDEGRTRLLDAAANPYYGFETLMRMGFGLNVVDDRCVQRLVNIESDGETNVLFASGKLRPLVKALNKLPGKGKKNTAIYCNADIKTQFDIYALEHLLGCSIAEDTFGRRITTFQGIPVRLMDAMVSTETAI